MHGTLIRDSDRRPGICVLATIVVSGAIAGFGGQASVWAAKPNVLFVAIDDLNDWIGCLEGHPQTLTPNLDELAKRGILFTNAHCAAPACNPSRAAVFSGMRPQQTGVWSNDSPKLPAHRPDIELLPTAFRKAGYATWGTGKLLHGGARSSAELFERSYFPEQRWSPLGRGEVDYSPEELRTKGTDHPKHVVHRDGQPFVTLPLNGMPSDRNPAQAKGESFDWGPMDVGDGQMGDTQITTWAVQQLDGAREKPFFLGVGYYRPHIPLWAPSKYFAPFLAGPIHLPDVPENDLDDLSSTGKRWAKEPITAGAHRTVLRFGQWEAAVRGYLACVHYVDHEVGRLVRGLDRSKASDNTWIIVWSDHGWHLGEKEHWGKWTGWERSTRVPLIVVPPKSEANRYAAGQRCERPVNLLDLFPTLNETCGLTTNHNFAGRSLLPLLLNPQAQPDRSSVTLFDQGNVSVRLATSRYIRYADGTEEFYDHENDPQEFHNAISAETSRSEIQRARAIADKLDP